MYKKVRPISANPNHMRNRPYPISQKIHDIQRLSETRRSAMSKTLKPGSKDRTLSTTAVSNPTYNNTLMSSKFRNSVRMPRGATSKTLTNTRGDFIANKTIGNGPRDLMSHKASTHSVQTLQASTNSMALAGSKNLTQMVGLMKPSTPGLAAVYVNEHQHATIDQIERVFHKNLN